MIRLIHYDTESEIHVNGEKILTLTEIEADIAETILQELAWKNEIDFSIKNHSG